MNYAKIVTKRPNHRVAHYLFSKKIIIIDNNLINIGVTMLVQFILILNRMIMKFNYCLLLILFSGIIMAQEKKNDTHYLVDISTLDNYGIDTMEYIPMGVPIGSPVENFRSIDQNGDLFDLHKKLETGPVVLVFYRGHWCGICNRHLKSLESSLIELTTLGAHLVAVTPESAKGVKGTIEKTHASFPILSDSKNAIADLFDVSFHVTDKYDNKIEKMMGMSIAENNQQEDAILPVPATFVIGKEKKVIFSHFDPNYRNRLSVNDLTHVLKEL